MPGSVKVSVLEADHLPCTVQDGHLVSIKVNVGKREYQTKARQAFGGRIAPWKYEFSYTVTNLRDNLAIAALDCNEEVITKSEIQTPSIIQKGFWDGFFSFKGGGRLHLKLCFSLSDEERKKVEVMRLEALKRKGLQNLLYRSTYQMPKSVPVKQTRSFISSVTITEIPSDSCLYVKDNENKENHGDIIPSLRCPKLLDAPNDKRPPSEAFLPLNGLKPLAVQCKSTNVVIEAEHPCNSPSDLHDTQNKNLSVSFGLNIEEMPHTALASKPNSEISKEASPGVKQVITADAENGSSLLLPEASAFMGDLPSSDNVCGFGHSIPSNFNVVPTVVPSETIGPVEAAQMETASMPASIACNPNNIKPVVDVIPIYNMSVTSATIPLPSFAEYSGSVRDPKTDESICTETVRATKEPDKTTEATQVTAALDTCNAETCECTLQSPVAEQSCNEGGTGLVHGLESTMEVDELQLAEKVQAVKQSENAAVEDVAKKIDFDKGVDAGSRITFAFDNGKLSKNLPWKSQAKGASEKFEWIVNRKRRAEDERRLNSQEAESADSEKANAIKKESSNMFYGWASAVLQPNGRIKTWISVALLLAGVIILGGDAIQRDLNSKKDSICAAEQGNKLHVIPSTQMDDCNASSFL